MRVVRRAVFVVVPFAAIVWLGTGVALPCGPGGMAMGGGGFGKLAGGGFGSGFGKAQFRFEKGQQARAAGNVKLASQFYLRTALAHPQNQFSYAAKHALMELADEGRRQLAAIESPLSGGDREEAMKRLNRLAADYANVPLLSREIGTRRRQFKRQWSSGIARPEQLLAARTRSLSSR